MTKWMPQTKARLLQRLIALLLLDAADLSEQERAEAEARFEMRMLRWTEERKGVSAFGRISSYALDFFRTCDLRTSRGRTAFEARPIAAVGQSTQS